MWYIFVNVARAIENIFFISQFARKIYTHELINFIECIFQHFCVTICLVLQETESKIHMGSLISRRLKIHSQLFHQNEFVGFSSMSDDFWFAMFRIYF